YPAVYELARLPLIRLDRLGHRGDVRPTEWMESRAVPLHSGDGCWRARLRHCEHRCVPETSRCRALTTHLRAAPMSGGVSHDEQDVNGRKGLENGGKDERRRLCGDRNQGKATRATFVRELKNLEAQRVVLVHPLLVLVQRISSQLPYSL